MKIGLEARWITFNSTGFGNYAQNLISNIANLDSNNQYWIYLNNNFENEDIFSNNNFKKIIIKKPPEIYKHICIQHDLWKNRNYIDFFHFLYNAPSIINIKPFVLTIHDVSYKYIPKMISLKNRMSILLQLSLNAKRAQKVITVSKHSKADIVKYFKVPEDKIHVIYESVDDNFGKRISKQREKDIRKIYNLPQKYILYVGTYLPHKNLENLIKAFHILNKNGKIEHKLVLVGKKYGLNYDIISKLIQDLKLETNIIKTGFVEDNDLPYLYLLSDLFVFPSLYEGFGLPILEAMKCRVPVALANASCFPEIAEAGAIYFDPYDIEDIYKKIELAIYNKEIRNNLIKCGNERVKKFSWSMTAQKTLDIYSEVYNKLQK